MHKAVYIVIAAIVLIAIFLPGKQETQQETIGTPQERAITTCTQDAKDIITLTRTLTTQENHCEEIQHLGVSQYCYALLTNDLPCYAGSEQEEQICKAIRDKQTTQCGNDAICNGILQGQCETSDDIDLCNAIKQRNIQTVQQTLAQECQEIVTGFQS